MLKKLILIFSIFAFGALFLLGCSTNEQNYTKGQNLENKNKDELIIAAGGEPEGGFDPTTGWGRYGSPLFQSTLLKRDSDMNIVNDLATEYSVSSDGLVWTLKLRRDVKFSDGTPLTAADVVFTYETASKSSSVVDLSMLESIEAVDDYTNFTLKYTIYIYKYIQIQALYLRLVQPEFPNHRLWTFKFVQWDKGQQLIVEANPEYYGEKPYFKKITFLFLNEEATFAAAQAGSVDIAAITPVHANQKVNGMRLEAIESIDNRGIMFPYVKSGGRTEEGYPIGNDVTSDISIRKL